MSLPLPDKYDITVEICSHNRRDTLKTVIESYIDQTLDPKRFEMVIVDDGSNDGTQEMVESMEVPFHLVCLRHERNAGLATARNTGLRVAQGKVVLITDDDVIADQHLLEEHLKVHNSFDKCVCNGWVNHVTEAKRPEKPRFTRADISTSFFWTSNVSVKRSDLFAAGLFDEDFKEYGWEDMEMGLRLRAIGVTKHNNMKAIGYHVKRAPRRCDLERICRQAEAQARTAVQYVRKHDIPRARLATGLHPIRFAMFRFATLFNWLETLCMHRLFRPSLTDTEYLHGFDVWCVKRLRFLYFFAEAKRILK